VRQAFTGVYIIDLAGELTSSVDAALLNAYYQVSSEGARVVILNFSQLAFKNSSGTKLLLTLLTRGKAARQRLFGVGLSVEYQYIFQVTQLDREIFSNTTASAPIPKSLSAPNEACAARSACPSRTGSSSPAKRLPNTSRLRSTVPSSPECEPPTKSCSPTPRKTDRYPSSGVGFHCL
jgi:anti-anti-sigma regulatory factor